MDDFNLSQDDEVMEGINKEMTTTTGGEGNANDSDAFGQKKKRRYTKKKSIASHLLDENKSMDFLHNDSNSGAALPLNSV